MWQGIDPFRINALLLCFSSGTNRVALLLNEKALCLILTYGRNMAAFL